MKRLLCLLLVSCTWLQAHELVELPLPKSNMVTMKLMFDVGSADDPSGQFGITHLTAQTVYGGGTQELTKEALNEKIFPMSASTSLVVDKEVVVFTVTIHKDHLAEFYPIFRDLITKPRFDESDFNREKKAALKSVTEDIPSNNDEVLSKRILDTLLFENTPYAHLVEGVEADLNKLELKDVKKWYGKNFTQANLMVGLAGGYSQDFKTTLLKDLKALPKGSKDKPAKIEPKMPEGIQVRIVSKENTFGTAVFMGFPMEAKRGHEDFAALMVANSWLGEHRKSYGRLYQKMRTTRSLNYGDYSYVEWYPQGHSYQQPQPGYPRRSNFFSIWIRPVQIAKQFEGIEGLETPHLGNGHFVIRQSLRELEQLVENGMSQEDFERTRQFLSGYVKLFVMSQSDRLGYLMDSKFYGLEDFIGNVSEQIKKLTREDVNKALRKHLQAKNMYVSVITDTSEAEKLAESLRENKSAPIVYKPVVRNGLSEDVLAEDAAIDAYKLNVTKVEVVDSKDLFRE